LVLGADSAAPHFALGHKLCSFAMVSNPERADKIKEFNIRKTNKNLFLV
jgi:hypothetical protein